MIVTIIILNNIIKTSYIYLTQLTDVCMMTKESGPVSCINLTTSIAPSFLDTSDIWSKAMKVPTRPSAKLNNDIYSFL